MKIAIAGCGNMGLIYAQAFKKFDYVSTDELLLIEKSEARAQWLSEQGVGKVVTTGDPLIAACEILILAVKPQDFDDLAAQLKKSIGGKTLIISIMAGIEVQKIGRLLQTPHIVRAMPNSPASVGLGITALFPYPGLSLELLRKAENLIGTTGRTLLLEEEDKMNAVTALSGSGPAYFFYLIQHMIEAGKSMGLSEAQSALLVKQTMLGAYHLISNADKSLEELIKTVASKGGTTEAALSTFAEGQLDAVLKKGILRAEARAKELSGK